MGLRLSYAATVDLGGATGAGMVWRAAAAIHAGPARAVRCVTAARRQKRSADRPKQSGQSLGRDTSAFAEFEILKTPHYLILFQGSKSFAESSGKVLEDLYKGLMDAFRKRDFPVHEERQALLEAEFTRLGLLLLLLDGLGHPVELQGTKLMGDRVWQHRNLSSGKDRSRGQRASSGSRLVPGGNRRGHARWRGRPPVALDLPARGEVRPGGA